MNKSIKNDSEDYMKILFKNIFFRNKFIIIRGARCSGKNYALKKYMEEQYVKNKKKYKD